VDHPVSLKTDEAHFIVGADRRRREGGRVRQLEAGRRFGRCARWGGCGIAGQLNQAVVVRVEADPAPGRAEIDARAVEGTRHKVVGEALRAVEELNAQRGDGVGIETADEVVGRVVVPAGIGVVHEGGRVVVRPIPEVRASGDAHGAGIHAGEVRVLAPLRLDP